MDSGDEDVERDFAKLSRIAQNNGYREGIQNQSELISQKCFDLGYSLGSRAGLTAGLYAGILSSVEKLDNTVSKETQETAESAKRDALFENVKKQHCRVCADESLSTVSSDVLQKTQSAANESLASKLSQKYSKALDETGIDPETINRIINK